MMTTREHRQMADRYGVTSETLKNWGIYRNTPASVIVGILDGKLSTNDDIGAALIDQSAAMEKDKARFEAVNNE